MMHILFSNNKCPPNIYGGVGGFFTDIEGLGIAYHDGQSGTVTTGAEPSTTFTALQHKPGPDTVYVLDEPTQIYENISDIHEGTTLTIYWQLNVLWSATCADDNGSLTVQNFLVLNWASGCSSFPYALTMAWAGHQNSSETQTPQSVQISGAMLTG
jgi:hypothetical protein